MSGAFKKSFKKNFLIYAAIGFGSVYAMQNIEVSDGGFKFLETSFVSILENMAEENKFEPVDLGIEKVTLKQIAEPNKALNYYKYAANIVIRNHGGALKNGQLILQTGNNGKHSFVKNDTEGFSLAKDQAYIIENYELLFDGNQNGGKLTVEIKLPEKVDYYPGNNKYEMEIFALPAKIQSLGIREIKSDGSVELTFDPADYSLTNGGFEIFKTEALNFDNEEARYAESSDGEYVYSYYRIRNSEDLMKNFRWSLIQGNDANPRNITLAENPFYDDKAHYIYLKSTNAENGDFVVSNIIQLVPQENLTRASFAKYFMKYAGVKLNDINSNLEKNITRGEVLKIVADYFKAKSKNTAPSAENFQPEKTATKNFLKNLINEYKKNS